MTNKQYKISLDIARAIIKGQGVKGLLKVGDYGHFDGGEVFYVLEAFAEEYRVSLCNDWHGTVDPLAAAYFDADDMTEKLTGLFERASILGISTR